MNSCLHCEHVIIYAETYFLINLYILWFFFIFAMLFGFVVYILGALLHLGHPDLLMANTAMSPVEISGFVGAADVLEEMIRNGSDAAVVGGADAAAPANGVAGSGAAPVAPDATAAPTGRGGQ